MASIQSNTQMPGRIDYPVVDSFTIQKCDLHRTVKYIQRNIGKIADDTPLMIIIEKIIEIHNKSDTNKRKFECSTGFQLGQVLNFEYKFYHRKIEGQSQQGLKARLRGGNNSTDYKHPEFLLFFYRERPREIFALSSRNAWEILKQCVDYLFPRAVAERILDANTIKWLKRKCLLGKKTVEEYTDPSSDILYAINSVYFRVLAFTCEVKRESSFQNYGRFSKLESISVRISMGSVHVLEKLAYEEYAGILDLFSKYRQGEKTYKKDGTEERIDPLFSFLHRLEAMENDEYAELDELLVRQIWRDYSSKMPYRAQFRHKHVDDYVHGREFRIELKEKTHVFERPPTLSHIMKLLIGIDDSMDADILYRTMRDSHLVYRNKRGVPERSRLTQCLEGEITDGEGKNYFKIGELWVVLKEDYHATVEENFKNILSKVLLTDSALFPFYWVGNTAPGKVTQQNLSKTLNLQAGNIVASWKKFKSLKFSYIKIEEINFSSLSEEILKIREINSHKEGVLKFAKDGRLPKGKEWTTLFGSDAPKIREELARKRRILGNDGTVLHPILSETVKNQFGLTAEAFNKLKSLLTTKYSRREKIKRDDIKSCMSLKSGKILSTWEKFKTIGVTYIQEGKVERSVLEGEILTVPGIQDNKDKIEAFLKEGNPFDDNEWKKVFGDNGDKFKRELMQGRALMDQEGYIVNPFLPKIAQEILELKDEAFKALGDFLKDHFRISRDFKAEREEVYNRKYLNMADKEGKEGYLVFDQVLPRGSKIEVADLIRYTPEITYFVQVKETLDEHARDACSQLLNAAKMLRSALSCNDSESYIKHLFDEASKLPEKSESEVYKEFRKSVKKTIDELTYERFKAIFERKVVFVYACLDHKLSNEQSRPSRIRDELKDYEKDEKKRDQLLQQLRDLHYLDAFNRLGSRFYEANQKTFIVPDHDSKKIYSLLCKCKSGVRSLIAKLEVLQLAEQIQKLGFEFKLYEIQRPTCLPLDVTAEDELDEELDIKGKKDELDKVSRIDGLPNFTNGMTNICWLNASLQALFRIPALRELIHATRPSMKVELQKVVKEIREKAAADRQLRQDNLKKAGEDRPHDDPLRDILIGLVRGNAAKLKNGFRKLQKSNLTLKAIKEHGDDFTLYNTLQAESEKRAKENAEKSLLEKLLQENENEFEKELEAKEKELDDQEKCQSVLKDLDEKMQKGDVAGRDKAHRALHDLTVSKRVPGLQQDHDDLFLTPALQAVNFFASVVVTRSSIDRSYSSSSDEIMRSFHVGLEEKENLNYLDLIQKELTDDVDNSDNPWTPDGDKGPAFPQYSKITRFTSIPKMLIVTLKKTQVQGAGKLREDLESQRKSQAEAPQQMSLPQRNQAFNMERHRASIDIPDPLVFNKEEFLTTDACKTSTDRIGYRLRACVIQQGEGTQSGHFIAIVRKEGKGWHRYSDTDVTLLAENEWKDLVAQSYTQYWEVIKQEEEGKDKGSATSSAPAAGLASIAAGIPASSTPMPGAATPAPSVPGAAAAIAGSASSASVGSSPSRSQGADRKRSRGKAEIDGQDEEVALPLKKRPKQKNRKDKKNRLDIRTYMQVNTNSDNRPLPTHDIHKND